MNKIYSLRDCIIVNLKLSKAWALGRVGASFDSPILQVGTGCPGATGHKRQRSVVEGLAQVAERMSNGV